MRISNIHTKVVDQHIVYPDHVEYAVKGIRYEQTGDLRIWASARDRHPRKSSYQEFHPCSIAETKVSEFLSRKSRIGAHFG